MLSPATLTLLADAVLLLHFAVVLFVLGGGLAVWLGNWRWRWVNRLAFRALHGVAIAVVVGQAWAGQWCVLTVLESWLREQAGGSGYAQGFIQHWVHAWMFFSAPLWVFSLIYTAFGASVLFAWWRFPLAKHKPQGL